MSATELPRTILELEKFRQDIESELARRHNWAEQEEFWRNNAQFWGHEAKMSRARNYIAVAAMAATFTAAAMALLARVFLP